MQEPKRIFWLHSSIQLCGILHIVSVCYIQWFLEWYLFPCLSVLKFTSPSFPTSCWVLAVKSLQSCLTLCNPIDGSPPGSPVPGFLQARTLEWVTIAFSNVWKWKVKSESDVAQSCPTLSDPMDCSLPVSSIHGILQARVLEWGAIAFSGQRRQEYTMGQRQPLQ